MDLTFSFCFQLTGLLIIGLQMGMDIFSGKKHVQKGDKFVVKGHGE